MFAFQSIVILLTVVGMPALIAAAFLACFGVLAAPLAVLAYAVGYGLTAGFLSLPYRRAIRPGRFPRDLATRLYRGRRLYGLCWTLVSYCPPVLLLFLSVRPLKRAITALFGCPALADATFYPDTWLRDLPMLELGRGAYLGNKSTIGTNTALQNGTIVVGPIRVGARAVVGHLAAIGNSSILGDDAELGFRASLGMRSRVGARSRIGGTTTIAHGTRIGNDVVVGPSCYIGCRVRIADGLRIPAATVIPDGTRLSCQRDVDAIVGVCGATPTSDLAA